jgi:MFS transporter, PAT family, beta-lactamase induction signal transducer AmpG
MNQSEWTDEAALGTDSLAVAKEKPWIYGFLIAPAGVVANGVIQGGVLGYLLTQQHVSTGRQSALIAALAFPTTWYFLWAPITDFFVRRRTWLLCGGLLAAVLMGLAFLRADLSSSSALVLMFASACLAQLVVSSCGGMMGSMRSAVAKKTAGSFYQAGSLGFGALATWGIIWLYPRVGREVLAVTAATMIAVPTLFAFFAPVQPEISTGTFRGTMEHIWQECKETFFHWKALPYVACMTFPMASGSAIGLLTGLARQYHVNGDSVAWVNGWLGGILMAAGSGVMALIHTRARASVMYMVVALINCATMAVLWLGPMTPWTYYAGVTSYLFTVGACYAMFTAVVLEFLGDSGKSGSGRYSIINSLGNVPVLYMLRFDGWGGDKWGARGVGAVEAVVGGVGATILLAYFLTRKQVSPAVAERLPEA